jgi:hypothetical protein
VASSGAEHVVERIVVRGLARLLELEIEVLEADPPR